MFLNSQVDSAVKPRELGKEFNGHDRCGAGQEGWSGPASDASQVQGTGHRAETAFRRDPPRLTLKERGQRKETDPREGSAGADAQRRNPTGSPARNRSAWLHLRACRGWRGRERSTGDGERPEVLLEATPPLAQPALGRGGSTARAGNTPSFSRPRGGSGQQGPYRRTPAPLLGQPTRHRMHEQDPGGGPQTHSPGVPSTLRCSLPKAPQTHGGSQDSPFPQLDKNRPLDLQSSPFLVPRTWAQNGEATCLKPHSTVLCPECTPGLKHAALSPTPLLRKIPGPLGFPSHRKPALP